MQSCLYLSIQHNFLISFLVINIFSLLKVMIPIIPFN